MSYTKPALKYESNLFSSCSYEGPEVRLEDYEVVVGEEGSPFYRLKGLGFARYIYWKGYLISPDSPGAGQPARRDDVTETVDEIVSESLRQWIERRILPPTWQEVSLAWAKEVMEGGIRRPIKYGTPISLVADGVREIIEQEEEQDD